MRNIVLVPAFALALTLALGAAASPTPTGPAPAGPALTSPPHPRIQALIAAMEKAANAHDTDAFLKPFLHDSSLVFVINGEVIHGWDALHAAQLKWWNNGKSDAVYTQIGETQFTDVAPDVVLTTQRIGSKRTGPDGKPATGQFAVTDVWRSGPDGWQIIYAHESWAR
ncbi:MAG: nuclear transport factor 2 family protein [Gemmatimonadota bacterium]|jgi:uncharacterized protein (TIGR02246 family)